MRALCRCGTAVGYSDEDATCPTCSVPLRLGESLEEGVKPLPPSRRPTTEATCGACGATGLPYLLRPQRKGDEALAVGKCCWAVTYGAVYPTPQKDGVELSWDEVFGTIPGPALEAS